jgi:hypothetical protein
MGKRRPAGRSSRKRESPPGKLGASAAEGKPALESPNEITTRACEKKPG